jgi:hypothetical protein
MDFLALLLAAMAPNDKPKQDALQQQLAPGENDAVMLERGCPAPSEVAVRQLASGLRLELAIGAVINIAKVACDGLASIDQSAAAILTELKDAREDRKAGLDIQRQQLQAMQELKTGLMALSLAPAAAPAKPAKAAKAASEAPAPAADPAAEASPQ